MTDSPSSRSLNSDAVTANRRRQVHALAQEIMRDGSSLMTMAEAIERASVIIARKEVR